MISFDKLTPGMILLDIHKYRMGNTTMRAWGCWEVRVISVDPEARTAMCSWNGNPPTKYREGDFRKLRTKPTKAYLEQCERRKNGSWW